MGAAGTGRFRPFQRDDTQAGMGKLTLVVARNLHLKNLELDRMHHEFTKFLEKDNRTCLIRIEHSMHYTQHTSHITQQHTPVR